VAERAEMEKTMTRRLGLALCCLAAAGCLTASQRREEDLTTTARFWNDEFRWARWDSVGQSMTPEENALFQERRHLVEADLVLVDYEVTAIHFLEQSRAATVDVTLQWYMKSDPNVRQCSLQQRWEHRGGRWLMFKQRRVRGDRFPLVPEPAAEQGAPAPAAAPDPGSHPASP
jgi:hypothetical protein